MTKLEIAALIISVIGTGVLIVVAIGFTVLSIADWLWWRRHG